APAAVQPSEAPTAPLALPAPAGPLTVTIPAAPVPNRSLLIGSGLVRANSAPIGSETWNQLIGNDGTQDAGAAAVARLLNSPALLATLPNDPQVAESGTPPVRGPHAKVLDNLFGEPDPFDLI